MILLILQVGNILNAGFDQIFNLYNPAVLPVSDIIDTYVFRMSFQDPKNFGFTTAGIPDARTRAARGAHPRHPERARPGAERSDLRRSHPGLKPGAGARGNRPG